MTSASWPEAYPGSASASALGVPGSPDALRHASVDFLAQLGILVAPGDFYGPAARLHVRVALTATDERVAAAAARLLDAAISEP